MSKRLYKIYQTGYRAGIIIQTDETDEFRIAETEQDYFKQVCYFDPNTRQFLVAQGEKMNSPVDIDRVLFADICLGLFGDESHYEAIDPDLVKLEHIASLFDYSIYQQKMRQFMIDLLGVDLLGVNDIEDDEDDKP